MRLTAQRILADHLRINWFEGQPEPEPAGPEFWPSMRLDLTGATLIDLSFYRVLAAEARFAGATFIGAAQFYEATFGLSSFQAAKFTQEAAFSRASFTGHADFSKVTFAAKSWFSQASFDRDADFNDATFAGDAMFYGTRFAETAEFQPGIFKGDATFAQATFDGSAWFSSATFVHRASFGHAAFNGDVTFSGRDLRRHCRVRRGGLCRWRCQAAIQENAGPGAKRSARLAKGVASHAEPPRRIPARPPQGRSRLLTRQRCTRARCPE